MIDDIEILKAALPAFVVAAAEAQSRVDDLRGRIAQMEGVVTGPWEAQETAPPIVAAPLAATRGPRKCRKCGDDGHDARNCPGKPEEAAPAVETAREPIGKGRPRHVDSLENEDPMGFAKALECAGRFYKANAEKSAWVECSQSEAEALSA